MFASSRSILAKMEDDKKLRLLTQVERRGLCSRSVYVDNLTLINILCEH